MFCILLKWERFKVDKAINFTLKVLNQLYKMPISLCYHILCKIWMSRMSRKMSYLGWWVQRYLWMSFRTSLIRLYNWIRQRERRWLIFRHRKRRMFWIVQDLRIIVLLASYLMMMSGLKSNNIVDSNTKKISSMPKKGSPNKKKIPKVT